MRFSRYYQIIYQSIGKFMYFQKNIRTMCSKPSPPQCSIAPPGTLQVNEIWRFPYWIMLHINWSQIVCTLRKVEELYAKNQTQTPSVIVKFPFFACSHLFFPASLHTSHSEFFLGSQNDRRRFHNTSSSTNNADAHGLIMIMHPWVIYLDDCIFHIVHETKKRHYKNCDTDLVSK